MIEEDHATPPGTGEIPAMPVNEIRRKTKIDIPIHIVHVHEDILNTIKENEHSDDETLKEDLEIEKEEYIIHTKTKRENNNKEETNVENSNNLEENDIFAKELNHIQNAKGPLTIEDPFAALEWGSFVNIHICTKENKESIEPMLEETWDIPYPCDESDENEEVLKEEKIPHIERTTKKTKRQKRGTVSQNTVEEESGFTEEEENLEETQHIKEEVNITAVKVLIKRPTRKEVRKAQSAIYQAIKSARETNAQFKNTMYKPPKTHKETEETMKIQDSGIESETDGQQYRTSVNTVNTGNATSREEHKERKRIPHVEMTAEGKFVVKNLDRNPNAEEVGINSISIRKSFIVDLLINGTNARVLIDTGADINCISKSFVENNKYSNQNKGGIHTLITKEELKLVFGNDTTGATSTTTTRITLQGQGTTAHTRLVVIDNIPNVDAILGDQFFNEQDAVIEFANGKRKITLRNLPKGATNNEWVATGDNLAMSGHDDRSSSTHSYISAGRSTCR